LDQNIERRIRPFLAGDTNVRMHQVNAERIYSQRTNTHFRSRRLVTVNPWVIEIPKFQQHVYELDLKSIALIPRNINVGRTWTQRSLHLSHILKLQNAGPMPLNATLILPSLGLPSWNEKLKVLLRQSVSETSHQAAPKSRLVLLR
jgi:hypothetical protein